ncbi:MAG TPA: PAS domain-containing protein, partial [Caldilineaceae bacterium]|nr:PAS domain-containing protein [Caldilineaceae bacterium]
MRQPPPIVLAVTGSARGHDTLSSLLHGSSGKDWVLKVELVKQLDERPDEVCALLSQHQPDLLLLDCAGRVDAQLIRQLHQMAPRLPIIAVGDAADDRLLDESLAAGAQEYLPRDHLTAFWLRHVLRRVLAQSRASTTGEENFRLALQHAPLTLIRVDRNMRYTWVYNPHPDFSAEQMIGRQVGELHPSEQTATMVQAIRGVIESGVGTHVEYYNELSGGRDYYEATIEPLFDQAGDVQGALIVSVKVSSHKELIQALMLSEERYRSVAAASKALVWTTDAEGAFVEPQPSWQAYTGQPWAEHQGKGWLQAVHPDDRSRVAASWHEAIVGLTPYHFEGRLWHAPSQSYRYYEVRAVPLFDEKGAVREWVGACVDIHERKQLERALRENEEIFRVALKNLPISISRVDRDLRYTWLYNYHPDFMRYQVLGKSMEEMGPAPEFAELARLKRQVLATGQSIRQEYTITLSDGPHVYDLTLEPFFNEQGEVEGVTRAAVDITEHKRIEAELRQARDELEQRVAERTQALVEANERLQLEIAQRVRADQALAEVRCHLDRSREAERLHLAQELHDGPLQELSALQYQLSELARPLAGAAGAETLAVIRDMLDQINAQLRHLTQELRPPVLAHYGLAAAIRAHVEQMQQSQPMPPVELTLHEGPLPLPEGTALALFRICQQALRNALQHAQASRIWIRLAYEGAQVALEVRDNGVGFVVPDQWADLTRRGHLGMAGMAERAASIGG